MFKPGLLGQMILICQCLLASVALSDNPDFNYNESRVFSLEESNDGDYYIESEVKISNEYLSKQSIKKDTFFIYQPYFSKITKIKAMLGKSRISSSNINSYFDDFSDAFISDNKVHSIFINQKIKEGSIVTYNYEERIDELNFFPILRIPNTNYVESYKLSFNHDEDVEVSFEFFFPGDSLPYTVSRKDDDLTTILFQNIQNRTEKDFYPFNSFLAAIKVRFVKNGKILNDDRAEKFLEWYSSNTNIAPTLDSTCLSIIPDSVLNTGLSNREKLISIFNYTKNIKYLADERRGHSIIPYDPATILRNQWGDCKDKAALICAMATYLGLDVKMALVNTEDVAAFSGVHVENFNHVINVYRENGSNIFIDATTKYNSPEIVSEKLVGKYAFIVDKQNPVFEKIVLPMDSCDVETIISCNLDSLYKSRAVIKLRYDQAGIAKSVIHTRNREEQEIFFITWINDKYVKISFDKFSVENIAENLVTLTANADLSRFVIETKTRKYIPETPFSFLTNAIDKRNDDDLPVYLDSRNYFSLKIIISGNNFALADTSKIFKTNMTEFMFTTQNTNSGIVLDYIFKINQRIINEGKNGFLTFVKSYRDLKNELHILK